MVTTMNKLLIAVMTVLLSSSALANEIAVAPAVLPDGLPPLGETWRSENPYRGNPEAIAIGQQAYNQACARCHGADASTNAAPAPDLRNLNRFCKRIGDAELKAACMRDNDAYFAKTVRNGKVIVGVTHMPPWQGVLKQELAWAIQTFIESRKIASRE
jgi:cytochrome c-550 PedF